MPARPKKPSARAAAAAAAVPAAGGRKRRRSRTGLAQLNANTDEGMQVDCTVGGRGELGCSRRLTFAPDVGGPRSPGPMESTKRPKRRRRGNLTALPIYGLDDAEGDVEMAEVDSKDSDSPADHGQGTVRWLDAEVWYEVGGFLPLTDALSLGTLLENWKHTKKRIQSYRNSVRGRSVLDLRPLSIKGMANFVIKYIQDGGAPEVLLPAVRKIIIPSCSWMTERSAMGVICCCPELRELQAPSCGPWKVQNRKLLGSFLRDPNATQPCYGAVRHHLDSWKTVQWRSMGQWCPKLQMCCFEECFHFSNTDLYSLNTHVKGLETLILPRPQMVTRQAMQYFPTSVSRVHMHWGAGEQGPIQNLQVWPKQWKHLRISCMQNPDYENMAERMPDLESLEIDNADAPKLLASDLQIDLRRLPSALRVLRLRNAHLVDFKVALEMQCMAKIEVLQFASCQDESGCLASMMGELGPEAFIRKVRDHCPRLRRLDFSILRWASPGQEAPGIVFATASWPEKEVGDIGSEVGRDWSAPLTRYDRFLGGSLMPWGPVTGDLMIS